MRDGEGDNQVLLSNIMSKARLGVNSESRDGSAASAQRNVSKRQCAVACRRLQNPFLYFSSQRKKSYDKPDPAICGLPHLPKTGGP